VCHAWLSGNGIILYDLSEPHGAKGDVCVENLNTASEDCLFRNP
jgi:hypothetical protein